MSSSSLLQDPERQVERDARGHAFSERFGALADDTCPRPPRSGERVGPLRLDADHLRAAADAVRTMHAAARAAAAADRHEDDVDVRLRLEHLERVRADARDQQRLVRGVHVAQPALVLQLLDALARFVEVAAVFDQTRRRSARIAAFFSGLLPTGVDDRARARRHAGTPALSTVRDCPSSP